MASLIVLSALYFWDREYNHGRLLDGLDGMRRAISHSMFHYGKRGLAEHVDAVSGPQPRGQAIVPIAILISMGGRISLLGIGIRRLFVER